LDGDKQSQSQRIGADGNRRRYTRRNIDRSVSRGGFQEYPAARGQPRGEKEERDVRESAAEARSAYMRLAAFPFVAIFIHFVPHIVFSSEAGGAFGIEDEIVIVFL
jgi:hypothetical protein